MGFFFTSDKKSWVNMYWAVIRQSVKMTKTNMASETPQKIDFGKEEKITILLPSCFRALLCIRFVDVAFRYEKEDFWRTFAGVPCFQTYHCNIYDTHFDNELCEIYKIYAFQQVLVLIYL